MKYNKKTFEKAVEPAIKWLNDNCNPHCSIEITTTSAELKSGKLAHRTNEFIKNSYSPLPCLL